MNDGVIQNIKPWIVRRNLKTKTNKTKTKDLNQLNDFSVMNDQLKKNLKKHRIFVLKEQFYKTNNFNE